MNEAEAQRYQLIQKITSGMVYEAALKAGIKRSDFDIKYRPDARLVMMIRGGTHPILTLGIVFSTPDFQEHLKNVITGLKTVRRSTSIELLVRMVGRDRWLSSFIPTGMIPKIEPNCAYEVELVRKVRVKHRETGIVAEREAPEGSRGTKTWTELVRNAKIEVTQFARDVVQLKKAETNEEKPVTAS
ncbi:hypothetical protein LCGC14_2721900 [marine sediment metagenome]|uniref:Uncharacterized protein n=1 Tax=marine sediment metagenome TaxID=412755 RepID=A0A0F9BIZ3_9ZZZZ